jgi:DNA-binding beta-propeller fold protein YncE
MPGAGMSPYWTVATYDYVWVTNSGSMDIMQYDKMTLGPTGLSIPLAPEPRGIAFDGQNLWVACGTSGQLFKIRESDGAVLQTIGLGGDLYGVVFDGSHIWVTNSTANVVFKIRAFDGSVIGAFQTCSTPRMPAFDGVHVWVPCMDGNVSKF